MALHNQVVEENDSILVGRIEDDTYDRFQLDGVGRFKAGTGSAAPGPRPEIYIPIAAGTLTLTNSTQAREFLAGSNGNIWKIDGRPFSQIRLTGRVATVSSSSNTPLVGIVGKATSLSTTIGDYNIPLIEGGTDLEGSIFTGETYIDTGWQTLEADARVSVLFIAAYDEGGDGALDPVVANLGFYLR